MTSTTAAPSHTGPEPVEAVMERLRRTVATGRTRSRSWRARQLAAIEKLLVEQGYKYDYSSFILPLSHTFGLSIPALRSTRTALDSRL